MSLYYAILNSDVLACPRLLEVEAVIRLLKQQHAVWLTGKSGSGKSITAYHAANAFSQEGWEILRLKQVELSINQLTASISAFRSPTILLLDDAQRVSPDLIFRITELVSDNLFLLCVANTDEDQQMGFVKIDGMRAVAEIRKFRLANRDQSLMAVRSLDNHVGEGYLQTSIEMRIDEAAKAETPWEFMFILTGG